jgi:hypothetical protein
MRDHAGPLGTIAQRWFEVMRRCGDDVPRIGDYATGPSAPRSAAQMARGTAVECLV